MDHDSVPDPLDALAPDLCAGHHLVPHGQRRAMGSVQM